jgi:hypothetical protein
MKNTICKTSLENLLRNLGVEQVAYAVEGGHVVAQFPVPARDAQSEEQYNSFQAFLMEFGCKAVMRMPSVIGGRQYDTMSVLNVAKWKHVPSQPVVLS